MRISILWTEEQFVCVNCFEDPGLVRFIKANVASRECSFCLNAGKLPIASPIDEVSDHLLKCLFTEYSLANDELGWIGSEGGWIGSHWDSHELCYEVLELEFPQENSDQLLPHLFGEYFDQEWCVVNPYGLNDDETARYSWEYFREVTMHQRRFFFLSYGSDTDEPDIYRPGEVLRTIFDYAQEYDLFEDIPLGTLLYRARFEGPEVHLETPEELGPPPRDSANQSNRMSPAGIPMFYGSDNEETSIKETSSGPGYYAVGKFETLRRATLLDISRIPPVPSLFDPIPERLEFRPRRVLKFLHHVAEQVSIPIERDDRVHVDYVPTQIVTEFIRDQLTWGKWSIDGIKYSSSVHPGHVSYVLFANQGNVHGTSAQNYPEDRWLKLVSVKHHKIGD